MQHLARFLRSALQIHESLSQGCTPDTLLAGDKEVNNMLSKMLTALRCLVLIAQTRFISNCFLRKPPLDFVITNGQENQLLFLN